jgi:squalene-associated FAD-dependent desaturase
VDSGVTKAPSPPAGRAEIAIIGGGWAGIACAVELAAAGYPVALHEAAKQLGGRGRGVDWNGLRIDNGQHLMIGAYEETLALLHRLGSLHLLERRPLQLQVPGFSLRLPQLPAPLHLALGLLVARGLSWRDKLAAVRFMEGLKARRFRLAEDLPVASLLHAYRQPASLIRRLWAPICVAALNTPVETASARVFCHVLRDSLAGRRSASDLLFNRADFGALISADKVAGQGVAVHLGSKVTGLTRAGSAYRLAGPEILAEQVVVAVHPGRLPGLLAGLPELAETGARVAAYAWEPILTLWLRFATAPAMPFPMFGLGDGQAPWAFERNDIAPGLVAIVMSADGPHLTQAAESLRDAYLDLLSRVIGPLPDLLDWKIITEKRATWRCVPDMFRPDNATALPGLFLAGDYTAGDYPATLEGAVRSGVNSARLIRHQKLNIENSP